MGAKTVSEYCIGYCGVACVDGSCPYADKPYREPQCDECWLYKGCEDCCFDGTEQCERRGDNG